MNNLFTSFLFCLFISSLFTKTITLHEDSNQNFKMTYGYPQNEEFARIKFHLTQDNVLTSSTRSTLVCANLASSGADIAAAPGDTAFSISFFCSGATCGNSLSANPSLFSSKVTNSTGAFAWTADRTDHSSKNVGGEQGDGLSITTTYGFSESDFSSTNIPAVGSTTYLK